MKIRLRVFTSTIKGLIRKFFRLSRTVHGRPRNVPVSVMLFYPHEHIQNVFVVAVGAVVA